MTKTHGHLARLLAHAAGAASRARPSEPPAAPRTPDNS